MRRMVRGFWCGVIFALGLEMFIQDGMGLDRYVATVTANWADISPWFGFLVMLLALFPILLTAISRWAERHIEVSREEGTE